MTWLRFVDADGGGIGTATLASRNLYGAAVDEIFATEVASGDVLWALSDHQSTVRDWATFDDATDTTTVNDTSTTRRLAASNSCFVGIESVATAGFVLVRIRCRLALRIPRAVGAEADGRRY